MAPGAAGAAIGAVSGGVLRLNFASHLPIQRRCALSKSQRHWSVLLRTPAALQGSVRASRCARCSPGRPRPPALRPTPRSPTARPPASRIPGGNPQSVDSNVVELRVDEILDVTVVRNDAGNVSVSSPDSDDPLSFTITNPGNGSEAYTLVADAALGGDQYNPSDTRIWLDDGDGVFEPAQDTPYSAGVNDPVLAPDGSLVVFVSNDTPAGRGTGDTAAVLLTATAVTGSGDPGDAFPGLGTGGVAAVVGATGATASGQGAYVVSDSLATLVKSQSVADPFGGSRVMPGSIVTYTLALTVGGTGTLAGSMIDDSIPADTTYVAESIVLDGSPLSDVDRRRRRPLHRHRHRGRPRQPRAPAAHSVQFQVRID